MSDPAAVAALPEDVHAGLADMRSGRVHMRDALDLLADEFLDSRTISRLIGRPDMQVTDTFLDAWEHMGRPLRSSTVDLMDIIVRGNQHPAMNMVVLGGGVFAISAPFDVELIFARRPNGQVIWLSVAA